MPMLEIVVSGIGGGFLQIPQNGFGTLDSEVSQEPTAALPEFEVGDLDQVLHKRPRRLAPQGRRAHYGEADGLSDPGNEFLPSRIISRSGAETDDVFQGQGRIARRSWGVRHPVMNVPGCGGDRLS